MDSLTPGVQSENLSEGSGAQDCSINEAGVDCELERTDKAIGGSRGSSTQTGGRRRPSN